MQLGMCQGLGLKRMAGALVKAVRTAGMVEVRAKRNRKHRSWSQLGNQWRERHDAGAAVNEQVTLGPLNEPDRSGPTRIDVDFTQPRYIARLGVHPVPGFGHR